MDKGQNGFLGGQKDIGKPTGARRYMEHEGTCRWFCLAEVIDKKVRK